MDGERGFAYILVRNLFLLYEGLFTFAATFITAEGCCMSPTAGEISWWQDDLQKGCASMKKILSLSLALLMILAIPCTASATEAPSELIIESFSLDDVIKAPSITIEDDELVATASEGNQEMIIESFF